MVTGAGSTATLSQSSAIGPLQMGEVVTGSLTGAFTQTDTFPTAGGSVTGKTSNNATTLIDRTGVTGVDYSVFKVPASTDPAFAVAVASAYVASYGARTGLSYTEYGAWTIDPDAADPALDAGVFAGARLGSALSTSTPTSGTATFTGGATGYISQPGGAGGNGAMATFYGAASLTANFGAGTIAGSVTGITAYGTGSANNTATGSVNDITLTGRIDGVAYSGTAAAAATAGSAYNLSGATGKLNGAFYGPGAAETAGVFSLSGGAHNVTVLGSFGASSAAPCDRRLKTDIAPAGSTPGGVRLYAWRYAGGVARHIGPMAQDLLADPRFAGHVRADRDGLLWVDFSGLDFAPADIVAMRADGEAAIARWRSSPGPQS